MGMEETGHEALAAKVYKFGVLCLADHRIRQGTASYGVSALLISFPDHLGLHPFH
jgi:hypothetical protein